MKRKRNKPDGVILDLDDDEVVKQAIIDIYILNIKLFTMELIGFKLRNYRNLNFYVKENNNVQTITL